MEFSLKIKDEDQKMNDQSIKKKRLGKSGIEITGLGLGLWAAGGEEWGSVNDREILNTIDKALDRGVNFFDTADIYGKGHSEKLLGKTMKGRREKFIVATKIGWDGFDWENLVTAYKTPQKLLKGIEENLRRLNTDYIDVMQSHIFFQDATMEIFLEVFQKLKKDGKIRAYGTSTSDIGYLKAFNNDGNCASLQIDYSILNRTPELDIFQYCQKNDIGVIVRGPLAMGILTGKFKKNTKFGEDDFRQSWNKNPKEYETFLLDLRKVEKLKTLTKDGFIARLALQFVLSHPAVTSAIPGAKNVKQLEENLAVTSLPLLTAEQLEEIEKITPIGGGRKIWPA